MSYDSSDVVPLEPRLEPIRRRPGLYVGGRTRSEHSKGLFRTLLARAPRIGGGARLKRDGARFVYEDPMEAMWSGDGLKSLLYLNYGARDDSREPLTYTAALSKNALFQSGRGRTWSMSTRRGVCASPPTATDIAMFGVRIEFCLDTDILDVPPDEDILDVAWDVACRYPPYRLEVLGHQVFAPNGVRDHPVVRANPTPPVHASVGDTHIALAWAPDKSEPVIRVLGHRPGIERQIVGTLKTALKRPADAILPGLRLVAVPTESTSSWDRDLADAELEQAVLLAAFEYRRVMSRTPAF